MRWGAPYLVLLLLLGAIPGTASGADRIPVPTPRPQIAQSTISSFVPVPMPRPSAFDVVRFRTEQPKVSGLPKEERLCRQRLELLGVSFKPAKRIVGKGACGVRYPIEVRGLPGGIKLSGKAMINCRTAEQLALWTSETAAPAAKRIYGSRLVGIDQFASYVCRTRNSQKGAKLSEHSIGNAIDLGRFRLADGTTIEVGYPAKNENRRRKFLKALRDSGCTYFTTVLGPGSDAFHDNHFHFDVAQRKRGYRYCR